MAKTPEKILVQVKYEVELDLRAVVAIAEECLEWVERQGFELKESNVAAADQRSYSELAADFAEEWAAKTPLPD